MVVVREMVLLLVLARAQLSLIRPLLRMVAESAGGLGRGETVGTGAGAGAGVGCSGDGVGDGDCGGFGVHGGDNIGVGRFQLSFGCSLLISLSL